MEKEKDFGRIRIAFGQGEKVEVIMPDIEVLKLSGSSIPHHIRIRAHIR